MRNLLLLLALPVLGSAQLLELGVSGGQSRLSHAALGSASSTPGSPNDYSLDGGFHLAFRMTTNSDGRTGHEFGYAYNRTQLVYETQGNAKQGMAIHQGFYNYLLYATREGSRVRPFATGGVHFANFVPPGSSATQGGGSTKFGVNYGGGIKIRINPMFLLRLDLRQYQTPKPFSLYERSGWLRQTVYSVGFSFVL